LIHKTIREGTIAQQVLPGAHRLAYKNKGVQLLLDAVNRYLPSPLDREIFAKNNNDGMWKSRWRPTPRRRSWRWRSNWSKNRLPGHVHADLPGNPEKGEFYFNSRQRRKARISRILRVHADQKRTSMRPVLAIRRRDGPRVCDRRYVLRRGNEFLPREHFRRRALHHLSISPSKRADYDKLSKALNRFMREDPTFRVHVDPETSETIISGMGELHLEIYVERIRREYKVDCAVGAPRSAIASRRPRSRRSTTSTQANRWLGQYAHVVGVDGAAPSRRSRAVRIRERCHGWPDPDEYIPSVEKGSAIDAQGPVAGYEVIASR